MAISAKFIADFSQFTAAVKQAEGSVKSLETGVKAIGTAVVASLASGEIRRFASDVKNVASDFISAFAEEEAAVSRLTTALRTQGSFTPELARQYAALGAEFQRTTRFSDDAIAGTQALLVQVGGVMPAQMKGALTAITNLAAGMDDQVGGLAGASLLVAKAFSSEGEALGKLKVILGDTLKPGADMAAVMEAINSKFGGQAAADLETASGSWAQLNNVLGDFKERVGGALLTVLTPLMQAFQSMPESMQTAIAGFVVIGAALVPLALSFAAVVAVVTPLVGLIGGAAGLAGAFAAIVPFLLPAGVIIGGIVAVYLAFKNWEAITGFVQGVYEGVKLWLVDKFEAVVAWVQEKINAIVASFKYLYEAVVGSSTVPDLVKGIESEFKKLDRVMVQPVIKATMQTAQSFEGAGGALVRGGGASLAVAGGGGGVINVVNYVNGTGADVARVMEEQLVRSAKLKGLMGGGR